MALLMCLSQRLSPHSPQRLSAHLSKRNTRPFTATVLAVSLAGGVISPAHADVASVVKNIDKLPLQGLEGFPTYPTPIQHEGAPVPHPFPLDYLGGYISDISSHEFGIYSEVINNFNALKNNPAIMQKNLDIVVQVNNAAVNYPQLIERAQLDAASDTGGLIAAISDALGAEMAKAFREALVENRLPKTNFLLGNGYLARAGGLASSTFVEKKVFNMDRPFVVAPDRIHKYHKQGQGFYDLGGSKSFPSGHTNQATWTTLLLAMALPEVGAQLVARGSEAGEHRMVMGVHYPLDVIGGRMTGTAAAADRWNDPRMRDAIRQAGDEIRAELKWRTGKDIAGIVRDDKPYRTTAQAVQEHTKRMTAGFDQIGNHNAPMIVPQAAPDLLLPAFPNLDYAQRAEVLRQTALPSGYPLDDQGPKGSWQRLNLAAAMAATVTVNADGTVIVK